MLFASENERELNELTLEEFSQFSSYIEDDVFKACSI